MEWPDVPPLQYAALRPVGPAILRSRIDGARRLLSGICSQE